MLLLLLREGLNCERLQADRIVLAALCQFDYLFSDQLCNRIGAVVQGKCLQHVLEDLSESDDKLRWKHVPFQQAFDWHFFLPHSPDA